MNIIVLFFGITTDLVGENSIKLELNELSSVKSLKNNLTESYPSLKNINDFAIAVNEDYASDTIILKEGDIVAVIPPVSGG